MESQSSASASSAHEASAQSAAWLESDPSSRLGPERYKFFTSYCQLAAEELLPHLHRIVGHVIILRSSPLTSVKRTAAWKVRPYPYIGQWGFLNSKIAKLPHYSQLLRRATEGARVLDMGCGLGQDLRQLAFDGAPSHSLYGADIEPSFWELGNDLFRDRDRFHGQFIEIDLLAPAAEILARVQVSLDIIHVSGVLHLWDQYSQTKAIRTLVTLSKTGTEICGSQMGRATGSAAPPWIQGSQVPFLHDRNTFRALWDEAARQSKTRWDIEVNITELKYILSGKTDKDWINENTRQLWFRATRVE
ncbi:hypothetical protein G7Y89_g9556 [Cudoniella acicularis]|uniref:Methyltransferase type 12 domain-containing protein n=1 Tax=Cudoniella acicularis TaxID=354080 RepID=A0A8H4RFY7_9HELO|nr:hypothetical protein G7Y89_g9556 [Cudoniella acicularis]